MPPSERLLIAVMGTPASGKTPLAEALARELDAVLVNADAFQIYRGMDIGTAKPERKDLYELIDIKDPTEDFGVGEFVEIAAAALRRTERNAVVVGGTGLYVRALFEGYEAMQPAPPPELRAELSEIQTAEGLEGLTRRLEALAPEIAASVDLRNPARVRRALERAMDPRPPLKVELPLFRKAKVALVPNPEILQKRIDARLEKMVQNGWVEEVRLLRDKGIPREAPGFRAIGYRTLYDHLAGSSTLDESREGIGLETRRYAKRQRTWLRTEPGLRVLEGDLTTEHALELALREIAAQV